MTRQRPAPEGERRPKSLSSTELKRLHRTWRRQTTGRLALLLDGVQNPFNLGSITRNAAVYRVDQAWLVGAPDALSGTKVNKTGMGSDRLVPWEVVATTEEATAAARAAGYRLVAVELVEGATPLFAVDLRQATCLVVGHEERGVSGAGLASCDEVAFLPQVGKVGSLNVAAATAVALYEARRQDWTGETRPGETPAT